MKRRLVNALALASLMLCLVAAALWIRSRWTDDVFRLTTHAADGGYIEFELDSAEGLLMPGGVRGFPPREPSQFGFQWTSTPIAVASPPDDWGFGFDTLPRTHPDEDSSWYLMFPHWFALLILVSPAFPWFWMRIRGARANQRARQNRCSRCGYDLRATPERCPECGTVPKTIQISN